MLCLDSTLRSRKARENTGSMCCVMGAAGTATQQQQWGSLRATEATSAHTGVLTMKRPRERLNQMNPKMHMKVNCGQRVRGYGHGNGLGVKD